MADYNYLSDGRPAGVVLGNAATDLVGFYGTAPAAQVAATAITALGTTTFSVAFTGIYGFASSTAAAALVARVNQLVVDVGVLKTMGLLG